MSTIQHTADNMRKELLQLLSVSATLSGLCITVVAFMHNFGKAAQAATIVDDIFAICSLLFLICMYVIFFALRVNRTITLANLVKLVDVVFLASFSTMTLAAFIMVYTVW